QDQQHGADQREPLPRLDREHERERNRHNKDDQLLAECCLAPRRRKKPVPGVDAGAQDAIQGASTKRTPHECVPRPHSIIPSSSSDYCAVPMPGGPAAVLIAPAAASALPSKRNTMISLCPDACKRN